MKRNKSNSVFESDLVSVVMPMYNAENSIERSIKSVLAQSYSNLELIIINDKSTDKSLEIAQKIKLKDNRINILNLNKNVGAGIARNKGINFSKGNIIAFLDSDDTWNPNKLEIQIQAMKKHDVALVCSGYDVVGMSHKHISLKIPNQKITYKRLLRSNVIGCLTVIYDVKKIGKQYMPKIRKRQDYALWLNITKKYGPALCVQKALSTYES